MWIVTGTTKAFLITLFIVLTMAAMAMLQVRLMYTPNGLGSAARPGENATLAPPTPAETGNSLLLPVYGVSASQLTDTWGAARSAGRVHQGIDIMAPMGTPVRAPAPGKVLKLFTSERGGITLYQLSGDRRFIYYYAHLQRYAPDIKEGDQLTRGQVLAFVGMTGNAPVPHLHFEIQRAVEEGKWWKGKAFNPYPSLRAGRLQAN